MLEDRLRKEWNEILAQEELLWKLKSRVDWLRKGDKNTRLFHLSTTIRRRKNIVECLLNDEGEWVVEKEKLKNLATNFYSQVILGGGA